MVDQIVVGAMSTRDRRGGCEHDSRVVLLEREDGERREQALGAERGQRRSRGDPRTVDSVADRGQVPSLAVEDERVFERVGRRDARDRRAATATRSTSRSRTRASVAASTGSMNAVRELGDTASVARALAAGAQLVRELRPEPGGLERGEIDRDVRRGQELGRCGRADRVSTTSDSGRARVGLRRACSTTRASRDRPDGEGIEPASSSTVATSSSRPPGESSATTLRSGAPVSVQQRRARHVPDRRESDRRSRRRPDRRRRSR